MTAGPHRRAVNAAVRAAKASTTDADRPVIQLACTIADQMDAYGDAVPSRLAASYLSVLKDLRKISAPPAWAPVARPSPLTTTDELAKKRGDWRSA